MAIYTQNSGLEDRKTESLLEYSEKRKKENNVLEEYNESKGIFNTLKMVRSDGGVYI